MASKLDLSHLDDNELRAVLKSQGIQWSSILPSDSSTGQPTNSSGALQATSSMTDLGTPKDGRTLLGTTMGQIHEGKIPNATWGRHFGQDRLPWQDPANIQSNQIDNAALGRAPGPGNNGTSERHMDSTLHNPPTGGGAGDMGSYQGLSPINPANGPEIYDQYRQEQSVGGRQGMPGSAFAGNTLDDYLPQHMRSRFGERGSPMQTTYGRDVYNMNLEGTLPGVPTSFGPNGMPQGPGWENYNPGVGIGSSPRSPAQSAVPDYRIPGQGIEANIGDGSHPLQVRQDKAPNAIDFGGNGGYDAYSRTQNKEISPNLFQRPDGSMFTSGARKVNFDINDMVQAGPGPNDTPDTLQNKFNLNNQSRQDFWASKLGLDSTIENRYFNGRADERNARMAQFAREYGPQGGRPGSGGPSGLQVSTNMSSNGGSVSASRPWTAQEQGMLSSGDYKGALGSFKADMKSNPEVQQGRAQVRANREATQRGGNNSNGR